MQRRAFERIPANIDVKFFCGNSIYSGTVTNLSENGLFIDTTMCLPFDSKLEILIVVEGEILKVPVKVSRIAKTDDYYHGMGVELLDSSPNYLEFINLIRSTS